MKSNSKIIFGLVFLVSLSFLIFFSCAPEIEVMDKQGAKMAGLESEFNGEICDGKKILKFDSLSDLQQEHFYLYQEYENNDQDEQVLIDYEDAHGFYSLRRKEQDMDDEIIPDDPSFDETNFTFDPILETLLNEDGMIIIGERLYVWDSGCIIYSIPFSCSNYEKLLAFYQASKVNATDTMHDIYINTGMQSTNICDDSSYDFELISENGGKIDKVEPRIKNKNGCGYDVVLNTELISCGADWNIFKVSFENILPVGAPSPLNLFYISSPFGDVDELEYSSNGISFTPIPVGTEDETYGYLLPFLDSFYVRIPSNITDIFEFTLRSTIGMFTGNSCTASDQAKIDNSCPFSIIAIKNYVNSSQASWTFSIVSGNGCNIGGQKVTWSFGDGTTVVGGFTETHVYSVPCAMQYLTVTATVDGPICGVSNKLFMKNNIPYGNPCTRDNYTFPRYKDKINGKKIVLRAKLKRNMFGKSVFKNVFKWRVNGTKTIKSIDNIYAPSASNGSCIASDISSVVPEKITTGKKRNRQRVASPAYYHINALDPYKVNFSHSNGFNHTLTATGLYCSQ